jgi:hypothetical protein
LSSFAFLRAFLGEPCYGCPRDAFDLDHFRPARRTGDDPNTSPRNCEAIGKECNQRIVRGTINRWSVKPHPQHTVHHTGNLVA